MAVAERRRLWEAMARPNISLLPRSGAVPDDDCCRALFFLSVHRDGGGAAVARKSVSSGCLAAISIRDERRAPGCISHGSNLKGSYVALGGESALLRRNVIAAINP